MIDLTILKPKLIVDIIDETKSGENKPVLPARKTLVKLVKKCVYMLN